MCLSGFCVVRFWWEQGIEGVKLHMQMTALGDRWEHRDILAKVPLKIYYESRDGEMVRRNHCWMQTSLLNYRDLIGDKLEIYGERELTVMMPKTIKFQYLGGKACRLERRCKLDEVANAALIKQD